MKVLSFDVGIKNLAACIIEWNSSTDSIGQSNLQIHYWDIINLLSSHNDKKHVDLSIDKCLFDGCKIKPKSYVNLDSVKYCFCTKHLTKKDILMANVTKSYDDSKWLQIKNKGISQCMKCDCKNIKSTLQTFYVNDKLNQTLCAKHYKIYMSKYSKSIAKICPIKKSKVDNMTTNEIKFHLIKCLEERAHILLNVDAILIENQPALANPKMKGVADTLYTWFMIRGTFDKHLNNSTINEVKFISPSNKLKEFDQKKIKEAKDTGNMKKAYDLTKALSVEITKMILASYGFNKWLDIILKFDKKDDLADSFLQGWYVLNDIFYDKPYIEWQKLYADTVINVNTNVEEKITSINFNIEPELSIAKVSKSVKSSKFVKSSKSNIITSNNNKKIKLQPLSSNVIDLIDSISLNQLIKSVKSVKSVKSIN